jgi:SAM-dependent methyltransferase
VTVPPHERLLINVGCGTREASALPPYFDSWRQLRVDVDPAVDPDVVADITDLSQIPDASADAVWAAHCIEHLYEHQVGLALAEFRRVLREDGFVCVIVPDLQAVARFVAEDRFHEPLYQAPAGPVSAHDVFFGFGAAIAAGRTSMAHRTGFTPASLQRSFRQQLFGELFITRRRADFEIAALARAQPGRDQSEGAALAAALGL